MEVLAIIPARGGSNTIPRKNIRPLAGKALIAWTIEAALKSKLIQRVVVSTDDNKIAAISRQWGAEVPFLRPVELAQDDTPTLPVLQHAVSWLKSTESYIPDLVVTLQPTSPLRRPEQIDQAISILQKTKADSVVSVCLAEHSPYWMKKLEGDKVFPFLESAKEYSRRQELPPVYRLNGAVYVTNCDVLMKEGKILGSDTRAIIMDAESSIDIDTPFDFKIAEFILKERESAKD